ncbi:MAG: glycosyltransferase family 2 protein [Drouetiella hepatica Uher 2000/2452]|jgi:hypothetical protein|uniref:Glycosyltransferase family 2 protein n=1 Tax=Drouetiella hepatica Uher 2000/2452 TaxID=904376 RepID=A0A951QDJ5_9CYAN|nr:glycosyltransferase family 2 protein [Drouetiella hepatica Uher 2000/2452]
MKIAIQNPFAGQLVAETELSRRIFLAAVNLGWEAIEVSASTEIKAFQPDFVIALHNNSPKLSDCPTYGCMWNPPSFFEGTEKYVQNVLSYDGYLTSSKAIDRWLHHLLYNTPKVFFTAPFFTSCPQNQYQAPQLENPRLAYLGSNWDGLRFQHLFEGLDDQDYMEVYGNSEGWQHLNHAYRGVIPYDGESVLRMLNQAGVGLCLHREEHRQAALPSMRIFEIVASGAIAICSDHPFIRETFGDSVLYIDPDVGYATQIEQISSHIQFIKDNLEAALDLSARAHSIFLKTYALEKLLLNLLPHHQTLVEQKGFALSQSLSYQQAPTVQIILKDGSQSPEQLANSLQQIAQQTYANCSVILVKSAGESIDCVLKNYQEKLPIYSVEISDSGYFSNWLWSGLQAIASTTCDYFMILDTACSIYPNHIQTLVNLLISSNLNAAYSGALSQDSEELINFYPFSIERILAFEKQQPLSGLMIKRSLLDAAFLTDPQLNKFEDLCMLLHIVQRTTPLFSYELTYTAPRLQPNLLPKIQDWSSELSRLKFIFWHQEFAPGKTLQSVQKSWLEQQQLRAKVKKLQSQLNQNQLLQQQLLEAKATLAAMQTSKFWRLRSAWFSLKRFLGLPAE